MELVAKKEYSVKRASKKRTCHFVFADFSFKPTNLSFRNGCVLKAAPCISHHQPLNILPVKGKASKSSKVKPSAKCPPSMM